MTLCDDIRELTARALWETENLIACIPDSLWEKRYDGLPMWKYVYHMLYSMDRWYINPCDPQYQDPSFHQKGLNDLNLMPKDERISRQEITTSEIAIRRIIESYLEGLEDAALGENPEGCGYSRLKLILGQFRHWHRHMGLIYGFLIQDEKKWPYVLNMCAPYPQTDPPVWYDP